MKKLMLAAVAALSFAVLAQDVPAEKSEGGSAGRRAPRERSAMMPGRGMMPRGDMMSDPAVMAAMNPKVAEKIGLSQEVRDQIKKLDKENREKVRDLQAKARVAVEKQAKLMKAEKLDEAAVMAAIDEVFDCRKEMAKAQTKRVIAVKALLTPEQLTKAVEVMKEIREERRAKRGQKAEAKPEGNPEGEYPPPPAK